VTGTLTRNSTTLDKLPLPPGLADDIFRHKLQESTASYGSSSYMVAVVTNVIPAPAPDKDPKLEGALADIQSRLKENVQNEILEQYMRHLAIKYGVSVND